VKLCVCVVCAVVSTPTAPPWLWAADSDRHSSRHIVDSHLFASCQGRSFFVAFVNYVLLQCKALFYSRVTEFKSCTVVSSSESGLMSAEMEHEAPRDALHSLANSDSASAINNISHQNTNLRWGAK